MEPSAPKQKRVTNTQPCRVCVCGQLEFHIDSFGYLGHAKSSDQVTDSAELPLWNSAAAPAACLTCT